MHNFWITLAVFGCASLTTAAVAITFYQYFLHHRFALSERVNRELSGRAAGSTSPLFGDLRRLGGQPSQTWSGAAEKVIEQAGISVSVKAVGLLSIGAAGACAALAWLPLGWIWAAAAAGLLGGMAPSAFILWLRRRRRWMLCTQLPKAFETISRAVRAGQTVPAAMQMVADDLDPPISAEFAFCYEQQNLGIQPEITLRDLANRCGVMELQIFVVALLVQSRTGGNLTELLDNLAVVVRRRLQLQQRVKALTGEGRMQALVLTLLPIMALGALLVLAPEYAQTLFERPWLLIGAGIAQLVGIVWIRSIVSVQY